MQLQVIINGNMTLFTHTQDATNFYVFFTFTFHSTFSIQILLVPPNFAISASPTSVTTTAGVAGTSTITVSRINGFTGTVALTATITPSSGLICTLAPSSIPGASGTSTLSCSGSGGFYSVTVTGTSGSLSHSTAVSYAVQDFGVSASPSSISVLQTTTNSSIVTAFSLGGFSGTVGLTVVASDPGLTVSLSPTMVTVPSMGSSTSLLTVTASATIVPGNYTVTVTGTSGSLSHSTTVTVTVIKLGVPVFVQGKLHWTHHLSLSKANNIQTFTAIVNNPAAIGLYVQVRIAGSYDTGGVFSAQSTVMLVAAGATVNRVFTAQVVTGAIGFKVSFTASLMYGTTATNLTNISPVTKSGTFGVVA